MSGKVFNSTPLINFQRWLWKIIFIYFVALTILYFLKFSLADSLAYWGIVGVFAATLVKLIILGIQFQKAELFRFSWLSYFLIVILLLIIVLKFWIL